MGHGYLQRDLHVNKRDLYSKRPIFPRKRHTKHTRDKQETNTRHKRELCSLERNIQETYRRHTRDIEKTYVHSRETYERPRFTRMRHTRDIKETYIHSRETQRDIHRRMFT